MIVFDVLANVLSVRAHILVELLVISLACLIDERPGGACLYSLLDITITTFSFDEDRCSCRWWSDDVDGPSRE